MLVGQRMLLAAQYEKMLNFPGNFHGVWRERVLTVVQWE